MKFEIHDPDVNMSEPSSYIPGAIMAIIGIGIFIVVLISLFN